METRSQNHQNNFGPNINQYTAMSTNNSFPLFPQVQQNDPIVKQKVLNEQFINSADQGPSSELIQFPVAQFRRTISREVPFNDFERLLFDHQAAIQTPSFPSFNLQQYQPHAFSHFQQCNRGNFVVLNGQQQQQSFRSGLQSGVPNPSNLFAAEFNQNFSQKLRSHIQSSFDEGPSEPKKEGLSHFQTQLKDKIHSEQIDSEQLFEEFSENNPENRILSNDLTRLETQKQEGRGEDAFNPEEFSQLKNKNSSQVPRSYLKLIKNKIFKGAFKSAKEKPTFNLKAFSEITGQKSKQKVDQINSKVLKLETENNQKLFLKFQEMKNQELSEMKQGVTKVLEQLRHEIKLITSLRQFRGASMDLKSVQNFEQSLVRVDISSAQSRPQNISPTILVSRSSDAESGNTVQTAEFGSPTLRKTDSIEELKDEEFCDSLDEASISEDKAEVKGHQLRSDISQESAKSSDGTDKTFLTSVLIIDEKKNIANSKDEAKTGN